MYQLYIFYICLFLTHTADNRKILHEQEAEKMLIQLLGHETQGVQIACAQALGVMSENLVSRESIGQWGRFCYVIIMNDLLDFQ